MAAAVARRLLLVEDNESLGRQVIAALDAAGYETDWIRDGDDALGAAFDRYSLVILDVMLPGASGFDILARLRRQGVDVPVLMTTARNDSADKRRALHLGANDYLTKPFWPRELLDRVAAQLEPRAASPPTDAIEIGELAVDLAARSVRVDGNLVCLTRAEFDLLAGLARRRGAAASRAWLFDQMAEPRPEAGAAGLDASVSRLKEKLGRAGTRIKPVWGIGYRLDG